MTSALAVQICRIVAPDKLPDRLLASGVLRKEGDASIKDQVVLAYLFEVTRPWFSSSTLLPTLTATLEAEYAKLTPAHPLDDQLEYVLKSVNQSLNKISEDGETDWIGSLNGIILVISGEEIHFSQTGRFPAYLLQNNRIRQITDDPQVNQEPHPLRTFANLASGHLIEGDQLLFANQELYNEISLDALRRILNSSTPLASSLTITKELKREKNPLVSSLIIKIENPASLPATPEAEVVSLEEEMQSVLKKLGRQLAPVAKKAKEIGKQAGAASLKAAQQTNVAFKEKVAPKASELIKKSIKSLREEDKKPEEIGTPTEVIVDETPVEPPVVEIIRSRSKQTHIHLEALAAAAQSRLEHQEAELPTRAFPEPNARPHTPPHPALIFLTKTLPHIILSVWAHVKLWLVVPKNKKTAALSLGVVIIIGTIAIALNSRHTSTGTTTEKSNNVAIIESISTLKDKIVTDIKQDQQVEAQKFAVQAGQAADTLQSPSTNQTQQVTQLLADINTLADPLSKTTRFTQATATYSLTAPANGFIATLPYFFAWNNTSSILRTGIGAAAQVQDSKILPDSSDIIIAAASSNEANVAGYALTRQNKVYRIMQNGSTTTLKAISPQSGDFAAGDTITTYNGNVYILDSKTGLLWKYANSGTTYAKGVSVIDINKYDIKNNVSLAIDGSIYFLKPNNTITKFTSGKQVPDFLLKNLPYNVQNPVQTSQIITAETFPSIYVLDAGSTSSNHSTARVIEYTKDGTFVRQYAFPADATRVRGFSINPKDKKLWILNGSGIEEFTLP